MKATKWDKTPMSESSDFYSFCIVLDHWAAFHLPKQFIKENAIQEAENPHSQQEDTLK